jgi:ribonuclease HI
MKYYAVKKGRNTGIYNTWDECKLQIHEYKGAQYKKFDTQEDAESFINPKSEKPEMKNISSFFNINNCQQEETNFINIFTDGSCYGNGKKPSYGGYGVYIVDNHEQNYMGVIEGNCTNNIAELKAILHVFKIFKNDIEKGKKIIIYTDSEYCIKCFTSYGDRLHAKAWRSPTPIPNLELVKEGYNFKKRYSKLIDINHIDAHTGKQDIFSLSNEKADELARRGMLEAISQSDNLGENIFKKGKYKGQTINDIEKKDAQYLIWYLNNYYDKKDNIFPVILKHYLEQKNYIINK